MILMTANFGFIYVGVEKNGHTLDAGDVEYASSRQ
jgi:hypothetical protein